MFGICHLSIIPCRREPSSQSEMVTQLLFGECFEIIGQQDDWQQVRHAYDGYECWISGKQFQPISRETFKKLEETPPPCTSELIQVIRNTTDNSLFPIVIGSVLPFFRHNECSFAGNHYVYEGDVAEPSVLDKNGVVETAFLFLNAPYLWGGRSPLGIDCSGFSQMVYKLNGGKLKRDAYQQAEQGNLLSFIEEAEPGDLAFFDNEEGRIIHVGIILSDNRIIHASGKVRIDKLDHYGIYNDDERNYTHRLRLLKRID
jgi:gamma-D-glutamyl-L-lysine dipeptidyl-peptidase